MKEIKSVLILGGGLAGCTLAVQLIKRGIHVTLISDSHKTSATRVAAGVFNPVVLKRLTLTGQASLALKKAHEFYAGFQQETGAPFHFRYPMIRIFDTAGESNDFLRLTHNPGFSEHIGEYNEPLPSIIHAPFGCGIVRTAGRLDTQLYLDTCYQYINRHGNVTDENFSEKNISETSSGPAYNGKTYDAIVFTQGFWVHESEMWSMLRFKSVSGEVLDVKIPGLPENATWHVGVYATPLGSGVFRVGATYLHENTEGVPTTAGKKEMLDKLSEHIHAPVQIIQHLAGVRPAAHDRNPYLGQHPVAKSVYVMNGLGSRGVLLAPLCAEMLCNNMLKNEDLPREWSLLRLIRKS
jgi:glycine oxidase